MFNKLGVLEPTSCLPQLFYFKVSATALDKAGSWIGNTVFTQI